MRYGIAIAAAVIVVLGLIAACNMSGDNRNLEEAAVCFNDSCFTAELALTPEEQSCGLMFRDHLEPESGMLFVFPQEGVYPFWMKNTLIPLDIIWIDGEGKVVYISKDAQPCKSVACPMMTPDREAKYVLEVNAGVSGQIGLGLGDMVTINYL